MTDIYESIGFEPGKPDGIEATYTVGYYIKGENGLYAFTHGDPGSINLDTDIPEYNIELDPAWPFIRPFELPIEE
ncbi:hypothetical protein GOY44_003000 [Klebsiella pneumoniae]|uniref:hypothetical protein n=1 Tax=Klebsiella pneumoniae TaxID=573 RepID=UPI001FAC764C|nr:hypothetical protein [Klebsiella pneumoniae]MCI7856921.1 hypothetical protein [Klebsiella pneumoniae]